MQASCLLCESFIWILERKESLGSSLWQRCYGTNPEFIQAADSLRRLLKMGALSPWRRVLGILCHRHRRGRILGDGVTALALAGGANDAALSWTIKTESALVESIKSYRGRKDMLLLFLVTHVQQIRITMGELSASTLYDNTPGCLAFCSLKEGERRIVPRRNDGRKMWCGVERAERGNSPMTLHQTFTTIPSIFFLGWRSWQWELISDGD